MREKVMSLAQGKFTYEMPEIICSTECLKFDVTEGGEATSVFRVSNAHKTKIKGFGAVDDFNFDFLPVFDGKENEITVKVFAANKKAGDILKGDIYIITDCGEYTLPYEIHVTGRCLENDSEPVHSYDEFVEIARKNFDGAVSLFYHDKFKSLYLKEMGEKRLYQNLTYKNPKKQALEEFLVAHGDKKPVQFMVNKKQLSYEINGEDISGEIAVAKDSWGMIGIKLKSDSNLISLSKSILYAGDFKEDQAVVSFRIAAADVSPGIHRCRIVLENIYQKLEVVVRIRGMEGAAVRREERARKEQIARITQCHVQYMMNSSLKDQWLKMLEEERGQLISSDEGIERILDGYISFLAGDEKRMNKFLNAVEGITPPASGESSDKVLRYLEILYICSRIRSEEEFSGEVCGEIMKYYTSGYRNWRLLVMLERLGYYKENSAGLLEELDVLWEDGCYSPYMHLYRMMLILQDTALLKKLDARTMGALRFGLKHDLMTQEIVIAVSFLAARQKRFIPALMSLLEGCYEMFGNNDTLHSICALLIRSERLEDKYFKWFQLGVEKRLRITELFEYYMYTLGKECFDEALPVVMTYFQYENHLRDSVKVSFYASIVRNREEHPEYFQIYQNAIREFTLAQLYEHHISEELAVLYEAFLSAENIKDHIARELPFILFTHRIRCTNKNMEKVAVVHDEGVGEILYHLVNGEAYIQIGTPHYKIYFVDKNGFYHADTISYQLDKILNLDFLSENCYENGSEHPVLLLHVFSKALQAEDTGARDALLLHMMIRKKLPGVEYTYKALLALYGYYKEIGEDLLLEEVIEQIDFKYLEPERRSGILQTMIQHKMNDRAMEVMKRYEIMDCSRKLILLLLTWKLEEGEGKFDPYYMRLCYFLYCHGEKNKVTLDYLVNFFMGSTDRLLAIYQAALKNETDISDGGTERLLGQALFVADSPAKYYDIFLDYFEYGANRMLVKAFLGYTAYEYLVGRCELSEAVLEKIQKEGLSEDNHIMILAMLRYYAGKEEYTDAEREYIEYHLSRYVSTGKIFTFMKEFVGKVEVPFAVEHADIIQLYSSHKGDIYIELWDGEEKKLTQPMRQVFDDIYVYETLLFQGESLRYLIFAGDMENPVQSGELEKREISKGDMAFYEMVNEMIEARESGDTERYEALVERYQSRQKVAEKLFVSL